MPEKKLTLNLKKIYWQYVYFTNIYSTFYLVSLFSCLAKDAPQNSDSFHFRRRFISSFFSCFGVLTCTLHAWVLASVRFWLPFSILNSIFLNLLLFWILRSTEIRVKEVLHSEILLSCFRRCFCGCFQRYLVILWSD